MRDTGARIAAAMALAALAALAFSSPAAANPLRGLQRMFKRWGLFRDVQISGHNTVTFQKHTVDGSVDTFRGQRWDTDSLVTQSSIHAEGSIWKEFGFQLDFSASGYGPKYSRWLVGYVGHDTAVYFGDLNVDISGNEFVAFRKTLKGWQIDQALPRGGILRYFESDEKGITRRQTFPGNDTSGPYFLTYTPIIEGSEVVKVDEQRMVFGKDYRLDYETGELRFEPVDGPPRIIPRTSVISVSYLSYGYGGAPGKLTGLRIEMPFMGKRMLVGYSQVEEKKPGKRGDTVAYHEDIYQGSGTTGPFDTTFRPIIANGTRVVYHGKEQVIEQALVVLVDNVEQKENVDYDAYRHIGRIIFRRAVPPTSLVVIRYYYDIRSQYIGGGAKVWGADVTWAVTPQIHLKFDYASSSSQQTGTSGSAEKLLASYQGGRLRLAGQWRNTDPGFSFLNAVGFYRHERGWQWRADYQVAEATTLYFEQSRAKSSQGYSFGYSGYTGGEGFGSYTPYGSPSYGGYSSYGGSYYGGYGDYGSYGGYGPTAQQAYTPTEGASRVSLDVTTKRTNYGFRFARPRWPGIQLDVQKMENLRGASDRSSYTARQLRVQYVPTDKPYSISANWSDTSQDAVRLAGEQNEETHSSTKQFQGSLTYTPSEKLSFSANIGRVTSDLGPQSHSTARSLQLSARWMPTEKLNISINRSTSKSSGRRLSYGYGGYGGYSGSYYGSYGGGLGFSPGGYGGLYGGYSGYSGYSGYGSYGGYSSMGSAQSDDGADDQPPLPPGGGGEGDQGGQAPEEPTVESTHYEDSSTNINISYQPSTRLSIDLSIGKRTYKSDGTGYLADSDQTYRNLSMMWQMSDALSLQASYGRDRMDFLKEDQGTVENKMLSLGLNFRPPEARWGLSVMFTKQDGSSPTYIGFGRGQRKIDVATSLRDLSGRVYYRLGDTTDAFLQVGTAKFSGGYAAFRKQTAEIGVEKRLSETARLTFGYRYIRNLTDESGLLPAYSGVAMQSQDYIAKTLLLTFNMSFHGGGGRGFRGPSGTGYGGYGYGGGYGGYGGYGFGGSITTFGGYPSDLWARQRGWGGSEVARVFGEYSGGYGGYGGIGGYTRGPGSFGGGVPGTPGWAGRGPKRPEKPAGQEDGTAPQEMVPPDPWEAVGDAVSLW